MPRFTHAVTGVTVSVDDDTAANLSASVWKPEGETSEAPSDGRPAGNASAEEWEAYALANGRTAEELQGLGRNEIRDLFPKE
jgi:hypothetical protein